MKQHLYISMPGALLLSYAVYTTFVPITIAHSLILFSLAGLFGYSCHLYSQKQPSFDKKLQNFQEQLEQKLKAQEETYAERLRKVEDVTGGLAIASARPSSPSLQKQNNDKKVLF